MGGRVTQERHTVNSAPRSRRALACGHTHLHHGTARALRPCMTPKAERISAAAAAKMDLLTARTLAHLGRHDEARELFAKHGISYVTPDETARLVAYLEGN